MSFSIIGEKLFSSQYNNAININSLSEEISETIGSSDSDGKLTLSTKSFISTKAFVISTSFLNSTIMFETPTELVEEIFLIHS